MAQYDPTVAGGARIAHAGTFNANPMTLVAGEAVMLALTPPIYRRLAELGESLRQKLRRDAAATGVPAQVTGIASLFGDALHAAADPELPRRRDGRRAR